MTTSKRIVASVRETLATRRAERLERQRLESELAAFVTPADRLDLEAILDRHSPEETREVRAILARQDLATRTTVTRLHPRHAA